MFKTQLDHWQSSKKRNSRQAAVPWKTYWPMMLAGLVMGLVIAAGLWIWKQVSDPNTLPFHEVRIQGQFNHLKLTELQQSAERSVNGGFFTLDMRGVKQKLMTFPWVEDVAVRRLPGILIIAVKEHVPVARWNDKYLFNNDAQIFEAPQDAPSDLPILEGPEDQAPIVLSSYQQIENLLKPINLKVTHLILNERGSWQMTLNDGIVVTIGREQMISRVEKLTYWYPKLIGDKSDHVANIDLRYPNSIAIGWKNPAEN
ncbi:MAG: cell division protein FtsQ/DivIB [Proteobacteria bacterium]|nr:cell division protein FtsQ/DivIB [Pseudomonadota bacterium]